MANNPQPDGRLARFANSVASHRRSPPRELRPASPPPTASTHPVTRRPPGPSCDTANLRVPIALPRTTIERYLHISAVKQIGNQCDCPRLCGEPSPFLTAPAIETRIAEPPARVSPTPSLRVSPRRKACRGRSSGGWRSQSSGGCRSQSSGGWRGQSGERVGARAGDRTLRDRKRRARTELDVRGRQARRSARSGPSCRTDRRRAGAGRGGGLASRPARSARYQGKWWCGSGTRDTGYHLREPRIRLAHRAPIAQLVELRTFNPQVPGSSPGGGTFDGPWRTVATARRRLRAWPGKPTPGRRLDRLPWDSTGGHRLIP